MDEYADEILADEEDSLSTLDLTSEFLANYGWYLLGISIALVYIFAKLKPSIESYLKQREEAAYAAKYHKDPDAVAARLAAQESRMLKLQEEYNRSAEEHLRKKQEKEAQKKQEWIDKQTNLPQKSGYSSLKNSDYNPLMGDTSRGYRPAKKSACGSGGCGK